MHVNTSATPPLSTPRAKPSLQTLICTRTGVQLTHTRIHMCNVFLAHVCTRRCQAQSRQPNPFARPWTHTHVCAARALCTLTLMHKRSTPPPLHTHTRNPILAHTHVCATAPLHNHAHTGTRANPSQCSLAHLTPLCLYTRVCKLEALLKHTRATLSLHTHTHANVCTAIQHPLCTPIHTTKRATPLLCRVVHMRWCTAIALHTRAHNLTCATSPLYTPTPAYARAT